MTTTMALAKAVMEKAELRANGYELRANGYELRANGYEVTDKKNMGYLTINSKYSFSDVCFEGFSTRTLM